MYLLNRLVSILLVNKIVWSKEQVNKQVWLIIKLILWVKEKRLGIKGKPLFLYDIRRLDKILAVFITLIEKWAILLITYENCYQSYSTIIIRTMIKFKTVLLSFINQNKNENFGNNTKCNVTIIRKYQWK